MSTNNVINQIGVLPYFQAYHNADQAGLTGDGTIVTLTFPDIIANVTTSFNGTTFTAPLTGIYHFECLLLSFTIAATMTVIQASLLTSDARNYYFMCGNAVPVAFYTLSGSVTVPLTAGQSVTCLFQVAGGAKTVGLVGKTSSGYYAPIFSGYMISGI
jgi:hypothetical protein